MSNFIKLKRVGNYNVINELILNCDNIISIYKVQEQTKIITVKEDYVVKESPDDILKMINEHKNQ